MKKRTMKLGDVIETKDGRIAVIVDGFDDDTVMVSPVSENKRLLKGCQVVTAPAHTVGLSRASYINCGLWPMETKDVSKKLGHLPSAIEDKVFSTLYRSNTEPVFS